jgi:hypothetical protein
LWPRRARYIAGFGKMGWLEGEQWESEFALSLTQEAQLLAHYGAQTQDELVGVDIAGCDVRRDQILQRYEFTDVGRSTEQVAAALEQLLQGF